MMDRTRRTAWVSEKLWRGNAVPLTFALLGVVALAATGIRAVEAPANLGLSGILPPTPPADLSEDEFAKLDGNWADWSKGAATVVADFYSKLDGSDVASQKQALETLKVKLDVMRRALDDPRYQSLAGPLTSLHSSLRLRIEFAEAALQTLEMDGSQEAVGRTKSRAGELQSAISSLESYLSTIGNGALWLPYFKVDVLKTSLQADPQGKATLEAALQTLAALQSRDYVLDPEQKKFASNARFDSLMNSTSRYIVAANWNNGAEAAAKLRAEFKAFSDSLDTYLATGEKARELRHAFGRVRFASADGGDRLASILQKRLFNYNLRVVANEDFLNRLIAQSRREVGPVTDFILGANVSGCQITDTDVSMNLKPSNSTARFELQLRGKIHSNTQGVTPQATVSTEGNHVFTAAKEINFDGFHFTTSPATISVLPHNTTTGITTKLSGVPILGRIAYRLAEHGVAAREPESTAITESRVRDGVLPRFNKDVDDSFATEGAKLNNEVFANLRSAGVFPDTYSYQTTETQLTINARVMSEEQIGADVPESFLMAPSGATTLFHETVVNNAIDHMGLAGQTLTEPEVRAKIETFITKVTNHPFKIDAPPKDPDAEEKGPNAIIFADTDPLRVRIQDGGLTLIIRAGFKQEGKDDIPMREINVPISFALIEDKVSIQRGNVIVRGDDVRINAVVRKKIQSVLPDRVVDGKFVITSPEKTVEIYIKKISMIDGWASVWLN